MRPYRWAIEHHAQQDAREVKYLETFLPTRQHLENLKEEEKLKEAAQRFNQLHSRMFYLAGMFDQAEENARKNGTTVREEFMKLQWETNADGSIKLVNGDPVVRLATLDDTTIQDRGSRRLGVTAGVAALPIRHAGSCGFAVLAQRLSAFRLAVSN